MLETKTLSIFEQTLLAKINNQSYHQMDYPFQEAKDLERFLYRNETLIHRFGNSLSTLQDNQWLQIGRDLQKMSFRKRQTAFSGVREICYNFLGLHYDELAGKVAAEQTAAVALRNITSKPSPLSLFMKWRTDKNIIRAAGAATVEIALFDMLLRLPQTPVFLPIFLDSGLNLREGNAPLMPQLIYHLE